MHFPVFEHLMKPELHSQPTRIAIAGQIFGFGTSQVGGQGLGNSLIVALQSPLQPRLPENVKSLVHNT